MICAIPELLMRKIGIGTKWEYGSNIVDVERSLSF